MTDRLRNAIRRQPQLAIGLSVALGMGAGAPMARLWLGFLAGALLAFALICWAHPPGMVERPAPVRPTAKGRIVRARRRPTNARARPGPRPGPADVERFGIEEP